MGKNWYESKTMWANCVALIAALLGAFAGIDIGIEEQGTLVVGIMAVVNIVLRKITDEGIK